MSTGRILTKDINNVSLNMAYDRDGFLSNIGSLSIQRDGMTPLVLGTQHLNVAQHCC